MRDDEFVWRGILDPTHVCGDIVSASHRLADAAKAGDWSTVFGLLDDPEQRVDVNWWRPGGTAGFTALHQAAWHGAPTDVVVELIARGALRSVTDSRGRTPYGVYLQRTKAKDSAHNAIRWLGSSSSHHPPMPTEQVRALDRHLAAVIDGRIRGVLFDDPQKVLRCPPVGILHEVPEQQLWFPVPGMYGGFHIMLRQDHLDVRSWCRVAGGSGQAHRVTDEGATLVDEGFVRRAGLPRTRSTVGFRQRCHPRNCPSDVSCSFARSYGARPLRSNHWQPRQAAWSMEGTASRTTPGCRDGQASGLSP